MGILKILLEELVDPKADITEAVRTICDEIMKQEKDKMKYPDFAPDGATVFLSLEAPGRYHYEIGFLSLEREDVEKYIAVYHTLDKSRMKEEDINPRRRKVWEINEPTAEKILKQFALKLKLLRGE